MAEWCLAHPWMTFILLIVLFSSISIKIPGKKVTKEWWQKARIYELEEIICPCEQHDWVEVSSKTNDDKTVMHEFMCRKCKKRKEETA